MQKHDMKSYHIYGIGAALVDTEVEVDDAFLLQNSVEKGVMTLVNTDRRNELMEVLKGHLVHSRRACGGSGANTAIAASCFGSRVFYSSRVANDDNGHFYLKDMSESGVDTPMSVDSDGITGKCLVLVTPDAERSMNTFLGASESLSVEDLDEGALKASEYLYLEGYQVTSETGRAATIEAHRVAKENDVKVALSLSDPGMVTYFREGLEQMIGDGVDLLFSNKAEAFEWANTDDLDVAIEELKKIAKTFAITLGKRGALVFDGSELIHIDPYPVEKVVDTNGAGDTFAGAFLHGLTAGHGYRKAGELASMASAYVVSAYGPRLAPEKYNEILKAVIS